MKKLCLLVLVFILSISFCYADGLELTDLDVKIDGDNADNVNTSGGDVDDVEPGSELKLILELENTWDEDTDDHDIRHIEIQVELDGMCDEDDQEFEEEVSRIKPDDNEDITFIFEVPECAEPDNYWLDVDIDGEDEDGTDYHISLRIDVEVEKQSHEVSLDEPVISQTTFGCDRSFDFEIFMQNIGSNDEDIGILIINNDLGINEFDWVELDTGEYDDEDTYFEYTYDFTIDEDVEAGEYTIRTEIEYAGKKEEKKAYTDIVIEDCVIEEEEEPVVEEEPEEEEEVVEEVNETITEEPVEEESTGVPLWYVVMLGLMVFVLLGVFIGLIFLLVKK